MSWSSPSLCSPLSLLFSALDNLAESRLRSPLFDQEIEVDTSLGLGSHGQ